MSTFKVYFSEGEIRRFKVSNPHYEEFLSILRQAKPGFFHENQVFALQYEDQDGDKITVSSEIEWEELLNQFPNKTIYLYVVEKNEKKMEEPERLDSDKKLVDLLENIVKEIAPLLEQYAPMIDEMIAGMKDRCGRFNGCPRFGQEGGRRGGCLRRKYRMLHRMAYECLGSKDPEVILRGKYLLLELLELFPHDKIGLYNLACAESLLGNVDEALKNLEKSIEAGYGDFEHILNDTDFDNIKDNDGFRVILEKYIKKEEEKIDQKVEEPKVEEKKDELDNMHKLLTDMGFDIPKEVLQELVSEGKRIDEIVNEIFN